MPSTRAAQKWSMSSKAAPRSTSPCLPRGVIAATFTPWNPVISNGVPAVHCIICARKLLLSMVDKSYLLNKPGRSGRSPRRTENHRFGSLFDQIRQGGHLSGSADPVTDVLKEVHSQFPGCAEQRFHCVPRPGTGQ